MDNADPRTLDYQPTLPENLGRGIGIVGAGGIVEYAHLPAYRNAGLRVIGITDVDAAKATRVAAAFGLPQVYPDLDALLADPEIAVVDIAVYPHAQLAVVERAAAASKHLLCQKPLADTYPRAVQTVEVAAAADVRLAVNQQMRWDAGIRYLKLLVAGGWLGEPTYASIQVHTLTDWSLWPWIYANNQLEVMFHSIHYIDSLRFLLGDPARIFTSGSLSPGETTPGETRTLSIWEYASGLRVLIDVCHGTWHDDRYATFRVEGSAGVAKGTIGLMYDYPRGRPDTLEVSSQSFANGAWFSPLLETRWIPDAFLGPMASLMRAIERGEEPETSGQDNLRTLQIVFAAYRSMAEGRAVGLDEIVADSVSAGRR